MGYPKIVEDAKGVMNLNFYAYSVRSLSCDVHHYRTTTSRLAHLQQPVHCLSFLITCTLKQDDLAAAFSATSLTQLKQNYSSGLVVENNMSLFAEIPMYFYFVQIYFPPKKHPKR